MTDALALVFLILSATLGLCFGLITLLFGRKLAGRKRKVMIFFGIFILSLAVGGIVTSSIGVSYRSHSYYSCSNYKSGYCYSGYYVYYYSRKAVSWVGFGLGSAALLVGLICSIYSIFEYRKLNRPAKAPKKALFKPQEKRVSSVDSSDIIESIQKLKILLDSGAISQEEFELLKKDKLSKL